VRERESPRDREEAPAYAPGSKIVGALTIQAHRAASDEVSYCTAPYLNIHERLCNRRNAGLARPGRVSGA